MEQEIDIAPLIWQENHLLVLDQSKLPNEEHWDPCRNGTEVIEAIRSMRIRGAPAIGVAGAYAMALHSMHITKQTGMPEFMKTLRGFASSLIAARPTAVNLQWAARRSLGLAEGCTSPQAATAQLIELAHQTKLSDIAINRKIGMYGADLMPGSGLVLTHCNTGSLATAGYGTALGVIRAARKQGKSFSVLFTETRPWLQGSRLTSWELQRLQIPSRLIVDSAAGSIMARGKVKAVVIGADRIARNGDTANKIGSYSLAVLAAAHSIPFYVAAPCSSVDIEIGSGSGIDVEVRSPDEITWFRDYRIAPHGIDVHNPAFDITPANLITAIITEHGVIRAPYERNLSDIMTTTVNRGDNAD